MLIIPAIDLKDGDCVRLKQGMMENATVFSEEPGTMARHWLDQGARRLHLVDLNGAFAGKPKNEPAIRDIVEAIGDEIPTQLGGGIRDLETIERYLDVMVGLDAKDGKVAVNGWSKVTGHDVVDLAKKFEDYGVEAIIYTDIGRDGMLSGVNVDATVELARALSIPVIASGGVTNLDDVKALCEIEAEGIMGAITGRALYEGTLDFKLAQALADSLCLK
jgi:phosphoribosylformimino-5-aminoimidazole carboxamide ribotide isomerase